MKQLFIFVCSFAIILMTGSALVSAIEKQDELSLPTGTMTLTAPEHSQTKMSPVVFPHSLHLKFSCKSCHHEWDLESPVKGCASSGCHEKLWASPPEDKPSGERKIKSLTGAYHKACRDCHRSQLKEQKTKNKQKTAGTATMSEGSGPVTCEACHPETHAAIVNSLDTLPIPLGTLTLTAPEGVEPKRPSVTFPHSGHFDYTCQTCHHEWDGKSPVQNCTVSGCHDQLESAEKTRNINDPKNSKYFLAAYHKACIQCHRSLLKQRDRLEKSGVLDDNILPEYGPVACVECHFEN
ncbi:MAG: cytochrome c3 family protein [Proteobacteria bacterium]|nr:cytochrome c3 family protein [Desulfobacula sp.]MBU4131042.1 cytochrome c3 family protein [Pseudomonadota bacterium]